MRVALKNLVLYSKDKVQRSCFNVAAVRQTVVYRTFMHWDLLSAVCLERKPVVTQELTPIEKQYFDCVQQIEFERSYLSDHELKHIEDIKIVQKLKEGKTETSDLALKQTAQDFEDTCIKELKSFQPASRFTSADTDGDKRSVNRKLDQSILLVVKQKLGTDYQWILPQAVHLQGETLRQTAERALKECGCNMQVHFCGNAPVGFYKYKYPKSARENGVHGAKVFFFKAVLLRKNLYSEILENNLNINDYLWLLHSELKEVFKPIYHKSVDAFLLSEEAEMGIENQTKKEAEEVKSVIVN